MLLDWTGPDQTGLTLRTGKVGGMRRHHERMERNCVYACVCACVGTRNDEKGRKKEVIHYSLT